jgi:adenine specific DNA methylase Mod
MTPRTPSTNTLHYADNLNIIYLDPPFNSNATYNVFFKAPDGHKSQAQIEAFDDTWHWNESSGQSAASAVAGHLGVQKGGAGEEGKRPE